MLDRSTQNNQRLYERYDCVYPIDLYYKHTLLGNGVIENISPEGLLLSIAEHNLHSDSVVEISFRSLNGSALINPTPYNSSLHNNEKIIVPAFVVHCQSKGIGVWLDNEDSILKFHIDCILGNIVQFR
jgi:hypothetical protein